ncbi:MAG: ASKHA domain-containing protein [Clostridioides sp.]|jgi:uncharacterized 2Fe-2S/4Fe-4S cluster protein (DUF4445 family)|nr:ASKHA domain-containing protein [Clostridioides sp.]
MSYLLLKEKNQQLYKKYQLTEGKNLLDSLREYKIEMESPCGGNGICGKCKVKIISGDINSITDEERRFLSNEELNDGVRLSCLVFPKGDVEVELIQNQNKSHKILTEGYIPTFEKSPVLSKKVFTTKRPTLERMFSYEDILIEEIECNLKSQSSKENSETSKENSESSKENSLVLSKSKLDNLKFKFDYDILKKLPEIFQADEFTAVYSDEELIGLEQNNTKDKIYAIALDIGTTTVVASLVDINTYEEIDSASEINPQKQYGLDVLSRIHFAKENENGLELLHQAIVECINTLIEKLCVENNIDRKSIYEICVAANTTMIHLLMNISTLSIGKSPYAPVFITSKSVKAKDLGVNISDFGRIYIMPGVSSFIGADIVSGACVCKLQDTDKNILFIDIGTNGEIVLSKKSKLSSCSCAAGPALEGMNISCGMRAQKGAIENIKIDEKVEINVIDNAKPIGLCGSGIIDAISEMVRLKVVGKTGRINKKSSIESNEDLKHLSANIIEIEKKRKFILDMNYPEISITQEDVRQVQLAKGAILSGFYALLKNENMDMNDLDEVVIAGQFGKHLSIDSMAGIGIIPKELKDKVRYIGNSAKAGAIMSILSKDVRKEMEEVANNINYCELSTQEGYDRLFADCLTFK